MSTLIRDIDVDRYGGWGDGCCYHPVARTAAVTAAAVTTAAVVGSVVNSIQSRAAPLRSTVLRTSSAVPPVYQPEFSGSSVTYVVVNAPR
jgi:hypothetical protein